MPLVARGLSYVVKTMCGYNPTQSDTIPCTRRESLSCPYLSRNLLDITEIHNGGKFLLNRGKAQLLPSLFPFDAVSSSYFVRSTCLLRTINVLTSYDQRQTDLMFWENTTDLLANSSDFLANSSDFLAKSSDLPANSSDLLVNTCGETCLLVR